MSPNEAKWFSHAFSNYGPQELSPMVNLGSSTSAYREVQSPHIEKILFAPLKQRDVKIVHADLKEEPGVDFVGNILDPEIRMLLCGLNVKSVLCSNVLEHVDDISTMCLALGEICPHGGCIFRPKMNTHSGST